MQEMLLSKPNCIKSWLHDLETRNTQEIQLGLTRIREVAKKLQLHHAKCKVISVAGTNGKGSTVTALETIYHGAGYKVGAYTSPHLMHFNERIRAHLQPITDEDLCYALSVIEEARAEIMLTYFEMTTLAALWYFNKLPLDLIILEVGLGGRLDATNIIDADLSIITTVDFDHQDFLGNTLNAIGYEKAGIIRPGKPFIYADTHAPETVVQVAKELAAPSYFLDNDYFIQEQENAWSVQLTLKDQLLVTVSELSKPKIQLKSAAAALIACLLLDEYLPIPQMQLQKAMQEIFIPGRLQFIQGEVNVLYDVSHNPQSVALLANNVPCILKKIAETTGKKAKVHAVFSALKDKDILGLISPLKDCVDHWYPAQLENKRALSAALILAFFKDAEIWIEKCYNDPLIAFETAHSRAQPGDLIVVYGSFFTVSQVMGCMS